MKSQKILVRLIIVISAFIGLASLYLLFYVTNPLKPIAGKGGSTAIENIGGSFDLIDQDGKSFTEEKLKGHLSLIYFGFTYCPDICPYSLNKLTKVLEVLAKYNIDILPIFITIDPERDKPEMLKLYLKNFHHKFIGLSGDAEQVKKAADKFKVYYAKIDNPLKSSSGYMLDHTSFIYLMDKKGNCIKIFYGNSTEEEIIEFIRVNQ